jgi:hypothetical protein
VWRTRAIIWPNTNSATDTALLPGILVTQILNCLAAVKSTRDGSTPTPVRAMILSRPRLSSM